MTSAWQKHKNEQAKIGRLVKAGALRASQRRSAAAIETARERIWDGEAGWREECSRLGRPVPPRISFKLAWAWWAENHGHGSAKVRQGIQGVQFNLFDQPPPKRAKKKGEK